MTRKAKTASFDPDAFLATVKHGRTMAEYRTGQVIFSQGDAADSVFYIVREYRRPSAVLRRTFCQKFFNNGLTIGKTQE